MDITYPTQAIPFWVHIIIFIASTIVVTLAIIFIRRYQKVRALYIFAEDVESRLSKLEKK